ncbi:MAG TPA: ElyC/SanA/YdcF family protein [Victivallales bacterium]|nr:ElyC/SanA/YdcF family protein [Victivallales bacterium]
MKKSVKKSLSSTFNLIKEIHVNREEFKEEHFDKTTAKKIHNQAKVEELIQDAIYFYWHGGDIKKNEDEFFKGITLRGKLDVVEAIFKKAIDLAPRRLDLRFDEASTEILQGKTKEALNTYEEILRMDPENFNASVLYAVYSRFGGNSKAYTTTINYLKKLYPDKIEKFINAINMTDKILHKKIKVIPKKYKRENNAIVILGYALSDNGGGISPVLEGRLKQGLKLFKLNPNSVIILSGGMPIGGVTESYVMKNWLLNKNVPNDKVYIDDLSEDTVGNGICTVNILKILEIKNATLITSASHIRRALAIFAEECTEENIYIKFDNLVYLDIPIGVLQDISHNEKIVIFRDLLRICGIWEYPGIKR